MHSYAITPRPSAYAEGGRLRHVGLAEEVLGHGAVAARNSPKNPHQHVQSHDRSDATIVVVESQPPRAETRPQGSHGRPTRFSRILRSPQHLVAAPDVSPPKWERKQELLLHAGGELEHCSPKIVGVSLRGELQLFLLHENRSGVDHYNQHAPSRVPPIPPMRNNVGFPYLLNALVLSSAKRDLREKERIWFGKTDGTPRGDRTAT